MLTAIAFTIVSVASLILTSTQALITFLFRRRERPFEDGRPGAPSRPADSLVSILKPVCGLGDELEENLLSFVSLRGIQYEVIISIEDRNDPALPIAAAAVRDHPDVFRVVVGNGMRDGVANRKVDRLISAARVARGEILFISDSNVRVQPEDIRKTIAAFENPRVGCVSNLFAGSGAQDLGASIESLHLAAFVTPGCALAAAASVPCVVGKSMAISRAALRAIGGFEAFRRVLAEDQAIGLAVKKAGYEVTLSPVVVRNVIVSRTLRRALERQIRWNKIRYAFSRTLYAAEILLQPLPLAAMAVLFGASPLLLTVVLLSRIATAAMIREATEARVRPWLMPLLDAMMFLAWFVPFFSNRITWRGYTARIVKGTELVPAEAAA